MYRRFLQHPYFTIISLTLLVRIVFLFWFWSGYYVRPATTLSQIYFMQGYGIVAGYGYIRPISDPAKAQFNAMYHRVSQKDTRRSPETFEIKSNNGFVPEISHPPGMPILVASILYIFDTEPHIIIQLLGIFFDLIAVAMVYWISRASFNEKVAFITGLLYAIFPPLARSSISMDPDGLITVFIIASFFCLLKSIYYNNWFMSIWLPLSGIALGLGGYLRPDFIFMPIFIVFGFWAYTRRFLRSLCAMALVQIIVLLTLFPWAYRNYTLTGRWIFSSTMVGAVLITGLGEFANPWGFGQLDEDREQQAAAQGLSSAWTSEADLYFRNIFFKSITNKPDAYLASIIKRLPFIIATPYEFGFSNPWKVKKFYELRQEGIDLYQTMLSYPLYIASVYFDYILMSLFNIICFFSLMVIFLKKSNNKRLIFFIMCPHFYNIISHILTHTEARFLLPTMYCLIIALAYALVNGFHKNNELTVDSH